MKAAATDLVPVVGLEVHAQLLTESKMFCSCSARYSGAPPNSHCCAVCTGMPGALPVLNARALEYGLLTALALNCEVASSSKFDRKNYSYPDLPKGFQISQYDEPIGRGGYLEFSSGGKSLRWAITRVHLEEDTGKTLHIDSNGTGASLVDYNRSGVPLMEIVTEPGSFSPAEARDFFSSLRQVLMYLGVNDGNLQEGSLRVDVNVSVHDSGGPLGTKVEVKNLNSFRALERSLEFEIERQSRLLHQGRAVEQETRGWVEKEEVTIGQRTKEYAHDYRYFPEPDLPPIVVSQERLIALRSHLPELPVPRLQRLTTQYNLPLEVARVLTQERALADYFESLVAAAPDLPARTLANWTINELLRALAESQTPYTAIPIPPASLGDLVRMVEQGQLSSSAGKRVLEEMYRTGEAAGAVVSRLDLTQLGDAAALESLVDAVLAEQPQLVDTYRSGKTNVLQAIIGQVMKASKGRANPAIVREILERRLGSRT